MLGLDYYVVISYDVSDNKRRIELSKFLLNYGSRVQKSVFEFHISRKQYKELLDGIKKIINHREDRIRYWELCKVCTSRIESEGLGKIDDDDEEIFTLFMI